MKPFKLLLVALVIMVNLLFAQPSFADPPKYTKDPHYIEVTQTLNKLLEAKKSPELAEGTAPEKIDKQIAELKFEKYAIETGNNWSQCRNETGKTLAVYGPNRKKSASSYDNTIYFLADSQATEAKWNCEGIYLPSGVTVTGLTPDGQAKELTSAVALKMVDGTQLIAKTNPDTGAIQLSAVPANIFKAGDVNWFIPDVSPEFIAARVPNIPMPEND
jgi:hypothetical protein